MRFFLCGGCDIPAPKISDRYSDHMEAAQDPYKRSQEIEKEIEADRQLLQKTQKILILGGPESGKSTIFKQMKILHLDGFSESDIVNYRYLIQSNLIHSMQQLVDGAQHLLIMIPDELKASIQYFNDCMHDRDPELTEELKDVIRTLYTSEYIKEALLRKSSFELLDSAEYFLNAFDRIGCKDYTPTDMDILRSRCPTTGITEIQFSFKKAVLRMVDVGGQRTEQRKWIHCFNNASGILFVVDIASFNQKILNYDILCRQPSSKHEAVIEKIENKLKYSMRLFRKTANNQCFSERTAFIIFLNKTDIFKEKLHKHSIKECFKEYKGAQTFEASARFIQERFQQLTLPTSNGQQKPLYFHFTNATDTQNIDRVFESCLDVVFKTCMENVGLM